MMYFLRKDLNNQKTKAAKAAFYWIVNILKTLNIPFQITGGLAAVVYGSNRPLEDIDIDIPEECFALVKEEVKDFIIYGPHRFKDETWDLMLMTLKYNGQLIDLAGVYNTKIFNKKTQKWQVCHVDFSKAEMKQCFDLEVPVMSKDELLFYKKIIARPVDLIDIEQIEMSSNNN